MNFCMLAIAAVLLCTCGCSPGADYSSAATVEASSDTAEGDAIQVEVGTIPGDEATEDEPNYGALSGFQDQTAAPAASAFSDSGDYAVEASAAKNSALSVSRSSNCIESASLRTCTDASGNTYTTQRIGSMSYTDGYNAETGSRWSQSTQRIGDTSFTTGTDADGNPWNSTTQRIGDTNFQYGTNSDGESFSNTCNEYGCF